MAYIKASEMRLIEELFNMRSGYVLDFTDRTFSEFFLDEMSIDIKDPKYTKNGTSKANCLRSFVRLEDDTTVLKAIKALREYHIATSGQTLYVTFPQGNQFNQMIERLGRTSNAPADEDITQSLTHFDKQGVREVWEKALSRRNSDPGGAITAARSLLETVCKRIIEEAGSTYEDHYDLPRLYSEAVKHLNLAPSQHSEEVFRKILGNCQSVVNNLGTIRNKIGDAHGQGARSVRPQGRHAALAVNLAGAMATFLVETFAEKFKRAS